MNTYADGQTAPSGGSEPARVQKECWLNFETEFIRTLDAFELGKKESLN